MIAHFQDAFPDGRNTSQELDTLGLMQQLGVIPTPEQASQKI